MAALSIREFNANVSKVFARVEAGEVIEVTRNGRVIAELRPKRADRTHDPVWRAEFETLMEEVEKGVPFGRSFAHDERNR